MYQNDQPIRHKSVSYAKWGYIFLIPFFLSFCIFTIIPLARTFFYSTFEYYRSGLKTIGHSHRVFHRYLPRSALEKISTKLRRPTGLGPMVLRPER